MDFAGIDLKAVFEPDIGLLDSFVRGTLIYFFVFFIMRSTLRRTAGELAMLDFIFVLLVANGAADSMVGGSISVTNGLMLIVTVVAWNYALNTLAWHIPMIERWTTPPPLQIVKDGKMLKRNMRKEFITTEELMAQLREDGVEDVGDVESAYLEGDGNISVIPYS
jgi:uncharacterized membrane protein YcaP (DUF421 family)